MATKHKKGTAITKNNDIDVPRLQRLFDVDAVVTPPPLSASPAPAPALAAAPLAHAHALPPPNPTATFIRDLQGNLNNAVETIRQLESRLRAITTEKDNLSQKLYAAQITANAFRSTLVAYEKHATGEWGSNGGSK
jgi:hypothetical protein